MTNREFTRICKDVMTPNFKFHWTEEVWKRGTSITEFRQMADDLDETGEEQTHLLIDALEERGVSDEEMLELSAGEDPAADYKRNYPDSPPLEMGQRLHCALGWDLHEAFGVLVRNAPKEM